MGMHNCLKLVDTVSFILEKVIHFFYIHKMQFLTTFHSFQLFSVFLTTCLFLQIIYLFLVYIFYLNVYYFNLDFINPFSGLFLFFYVILNLKNLLKFYSL